MEKNQKLQKSAKPGQIAIKGALSKPDIKGPDKPELKNVRPK